MSGEKDTIVNIRQSEYNRMMSTCRRMDNMDQTIQSNVHDMTQHLRQDMNQRFQTIQNRYDNMDQYVTNLSQDMQHIESSLQTQIQSHARQFQSSLSSLYDEMASQRREYTHLIHVQGQTFKKALEAQYDVLTSQINQIRDDIHRKTANEHEAAKQWLSDCRAYLQMIQSEYAHEKFKPGELHRLQNELTVSQSNLDHHNFQAAIASAQQTFLRASELRLTLEKLELEFEAHLEAAKCNATEVLATCNAQDACQLTFETEEGAEQIAGEIDFWTQGELSKIRQLAKDELTKLGAPDTLSIDDLKASMKQSETWRNQCLALSDQAKQTLIASQLRNNIGQTIEAALAESGWQVTDSVYEGDDFRSALHVKLSNLPGDEMVTIITPMPGPDNTIQNKVKISFFDRTNQDERFRLQRLEAITQMMQTQGLNCTPPTCQPGTENQPCKEHHRLNFEQVKQTTRPHSKGSADER